MSWCAAAVRGAALAAAVLGDREAARAAGNLPADVTTAIRARLAELSGPEGRAQMHELVASLEPGVPAERLQALGQGPTAARVRALLASSVPRDLGRQWLRASPPTRRGFRSSRVLRAQLLRLLREDPGAAWLG